jgi:basic membrane protein A and related proteins
MKLKSVSLTTALVGITMFALAACGGTTAEQATSSELPAASEAAQTQSESTADESATTGKLKVAAVYSGKIEEPWDGVIQSALDNAAEAGLIEVTMIDDVGYASGAFERTLRQVIEEQQPDLIVGDSFGNEEAARAVAADYPDVAIAFGSGGGPAEPNFSVFDNWIYQPAYLSGILAGGMTKSNIIGIVGGIPVPEVNRLINAFIMGAQSVNPKVEAKVTYINSWFDPAAAKESALAQIAAGADVLYAERAGVIEAAAEKGVYAVGNMSDQQADSPEYVLTSVMWSMEPTLAYLLDQVSKGSYAAQDLKDFSMMPKGGAILAPLNTGVKGGIPAGLSAKVDEALAGITSGVLRVDIDEATPAGSVVVEAAQ